MTAIVAERETIGYWNLIKDAGNEVKLALITLLSTSMAKDNEVLVKPRKLKARRLNPIADDDMERLMQGEPTPITDNETKYKMKKKEELSPVLQKILAMPKTGTLTDSDAEEARMAYYKEKYELA